MSDTGPKPSGTLNISAFFDSMQDAQSKNTADIARLEAELNNFKNLLAVHADRLDEGVKNAQELFDLRTAMVLHDNDAMKNQFREVSAVFQRSIEQLNQMLDSRLLVMEQRINSIKVADTAVTTARITRTQVITVALIGGAFSLMTILISALLARGAP